MSSWKRAVRTYRVVRRLELVLSEDRLLRDVSLEKAKRLKISDSLRRLSFLPEK